MLNPLTSMEVVRAKLLARAEVQDGCLIWLGCVQGNGYGRMTVMRHVDYVHRWMFFAEHGRMPVMPMEVLHSCDVRLCILPAHLSEGTRLDNMADCVRKGRQAKGAMLPDVRGEKAPWAKLTWAAVREIRAMPRDSGMARRVALHYGVDPSLIRMVVNNKIWKE